MSERTKIEWCDSTFNPWIGCTKVGPGCDHCYAESLMDKRHHRVVWGAGNPRSRTSIANWKQPLRWNEAAFVECPYCQWRGEWGEADERNGQCPSCSRIPPTFRDARRRVFCASLADVFDNEVADDWRVDLFRLIAATPNLDWLLLTKRIGNAASMLRTIMGTLNRDGIDSPHWPWPNVRIGATIVNQEEADRDIVKLLATPAHTRFLSIEPLLGSLDLRERLRWSCCLDYRPGDYPDDPPVCCCDPLPALDWVVVGGESGKDARPMHPNWARSIRDQCAEAGVPFLFKQWGEWAPGECGAQSPTHTERTAAWCFDRWHFSSLTPRESEEVHRDDEPELYRLGKKVAGRLLDGVQHNGFPG